MKYRECPYCGSNLDYGEKCECKEEHNNKIIVFDNYISQHTKDTRTGQIEFVWN